MDNDNRSKSLIFNLYQKYKKSKENEAVERTAQQQAAQGIPESEPEQVMEQKAVPVVEIIERNFDEQAEPSESIPAEYKYLQSMYELYTYICQERDDLKKSETIKEFEDRLYEPILDHPAYTTHLNVVHQFIDELNLMSSILQHKYKTEKEALLKADEPSELSEELEENNQPEESQEEETISSDASVYIRSIDNGMYALIFVMPPNAGREDISDQAMWEILAGNNIAYGINHELIYRIAKEHLYMQMFVIAQGTQPINGIDAQIVDKTNCRVQKSIRQDEKGKVDFKSLDTYEPISKDQVICELIPPVDGFAGSDIYGKELPFVPGKVLNLQTGKNTIISEDGLLLLAATGGYVSYRNGHYNVEPVLVVQENVDYSVGNIDFSGNVIINGDVRFGFTVKAQGDITVKGMVEGAELIADGDITINKGMNGNHSGTLNAKGAVKVSYLENCTVYSSGPVHADSIIACDIFCEDAVYLEGNRGIIIGGTVMALKGVEARMIGSKSQRETTIVLGETPRMVTRKNAIKTELEETEKVLEKLKLNIKYLEKLGGSLPADKRSILSQLTEQNALYEQKKVEMEQTLLELMRESTDFSNCFVKSNMIFPGTKIAIGSSSTVINTVSSQCKIYFNGDDIQMGSF